MHLFSAGFSTLVIGSPTGSSFGFLCHLQGFLLLLHLADLGHDDLAEDGAFDRFGQCPFITLTAALVSLRGGASRPIGCQRRICREIRVFGVIFLHLERLDTVCQLDHLDTTAETLPREEALDLG